MCATIHQSDLHLRQGAGRAHAAVVTRSYLWTDAPIGVRNTYRMDLLRQSNDTKELFERCQHETRMLSQRVGMILISKPGWNLVPRYQAEAAACG